MQRAFAEVKMLTGSAALEILVPQLSRRDFGMQSQNLRLQWGSGTQLQPHGLPGLLKSHKNPFERAEEDLSTDPKERLLQGGGRFGGSHFFRQGESRIPALGNCSVSSRWARNSLTYRQIKEKLQTHQAEQKLKTVPLLSLFCRKGFPDDTRFPFQIRHWPQCNLSKE